MEQVSESQAFGLVSIRVPVKWQVHKICSQRFFGKRQHELFHDVAGGSAPLLSVRFNDNKSLRDAAVRGSVSPNSRRCNSHALFIYGIASCSLCISGFFTTTRKFESLSSTVASFAMPTTNKHIDPRTHV